MKERLAKGIVRARWFFLPFFLLLAVVSVFFINKTNINYDFIVYLNENTMTRRALDKMNEEFGSSEQLRLMLTDSDDTAANALAAELNTWPEIMLASFDSQNGVAQRDGHTYRLITLTLNNCDASALVMSLRTRYPQACVGGSAAEQLDLQKSVGSEIPLAFALAVAVVLLVLILTTRSWLEPLIICVTLGVSILINMGTNFLFPSISFITFAVSAILQLALSIDYAIMLLNGYHARMEAGMKSKPAMTAALADTMMPITSSALTTAAGLLSLLFMSFTIGYDIGTALTKGILISMLTVFLFMPSLTLLMRKAINRTTHKAISLGGYRLGRGIWRLRVPLCIVLSLLIGFGAYLQTRNTFFFAGRNVNSGTADTESVRINTVFGTSDTLVLLVPGDDSDEAYAQQYYLVNDLSEIGFTDITAMVTTGGAALNYYTAKDVAEMTGLSEWVIKLAFTAKGFGDKVRGDKLITAADALTGRNEQVEALKSMMDTARNAFCGEHYGRMLLTIPKGTVIADKTRMIDETIAACGKYYGGDFYLTGNSMSVYDISNAFGDDLTKVNVITFFAILLIVLLSFRSLSIPVLLTLIIEGAIWLNMSVSVLTGEPVFFVSYLICVAIQMGATVDYGILLTDSYKRARQTAKRREAVSEALHYALPTVLTSGSILTVAGYIIGRICSIYYISSIGLLLARGTLISIFLVLTLLPAILVCLDGIVRGRKRER